MTRVRFETTFLKLMIALSGLAILTCLLLMGFAAHAQTVTTPAPSGIGDILKGLLSPGTVGVGLGAVLSLLGTLSFLTAKRKKILALASYYAFHIVEDIGNEIEGDDNFDKTATYLKKVDEWMLANGYRPAKPGEVDGLKLAAQAIHGEQVAKAKVAIAAAEAAAPVPS